MRLLQQFLLAFMILLLAFMLRVPTGSAAQLGQASILFTDPGTDLNPHLLAEIRALAGYLNKNPRAQLHIVRTLEGKRPQSAGDLATLARTLKIFRAFADLGIDPVRLGFEQKTGDASGKVVIAILDTETQTSTSHVVPTPGVTPGATTDALTVRYDSNGQPLLESDASVKSFLLTAGQPGRDQLAITPSLGAEETDNAAKSRAEVKALALYEILVRAGVPPARLVVAEPKKGPTPGQATFLWTKNDAVAARMKAEDAQVLQNPEARTGLNLAAGMEKFRESQVLQTTGETAAGMSGSTLVGSAPARGDEVGKHGIQKAAGKAGMNLAARSGVPANTEGNGIDQATTVKVQEPDPSRPHPNATHPMDPAARIGDDGLNPNTPGVPTHPSVIANPKLVKKKSTKKILVLTSDWTGLASLGLASPHDGLAEETSAAVNYGVGIERQLKRFNNNSSRAGLVFWRTTLSPKNNKLSGDLNLNALVIRSDYIWNLFSLKPYAGGGLGLYKWDGSIKQKVTGLVHSKNTLDSGLQLHGGMDWSLSPQFILAPEVAWSKIGGSFSDSFLVFQILVRWQF